MMMIRTVVLSMLASFKASQGAVRDLSADPAHGVTHVAPRPTQLYQALLACATC
jgi:hypothetical protein